MSKTILIGRLRLARLTYMKGVSYFSLCLSSLRYHLPGNGQ